MIAATTPTGSRTISELPTFSSHWTSSTSCGMEAKVPVGSPTWIIRASFSGMPMLGGDQGGDLVAALGELAPTPR